VPLFFEILVRGRWAPEAVQVRWHQEPFELEPEVGSAAAAALAALADRGSPSHDSVAARVCRYSAVNGTLTLELQPITWSARLVEGGASDSLSAILLVRDTRGRWLAGRRAGWLGSWPGRWMLGAAGGVDAGEHPVETLARELREEWNVQPEALSVRGLARLPSGMVWLVGQCLVPAGVDPTPNDEHDDWAWWPPVHGSWPPEASALARELAALFG